MNGIPDRLQISRRTAIGTGLAASAIGLTASLAAGSAAAQTGNGKTVFVLAHGSWHGAWSWGLVSNHLNAAGHATLAVDLPGEGLNTVFPKSYLHRPFDPGAFATERSPLADYDASDYSAPIVEAARHARAFGAERVFAVGHSLGGIPITFAAAEAPDAFDGLIYVAALVPTPGKPAGAHLGTEAQQNHYAAGGLIMADPAVVGAIRINPSSTDPDYIALSKSALAADVDDNLWSVALNMFTPDSPVDMVGETPEFPEGFGSLKRTYIRATQDMLIHPTVCDAYVADLNAAWPNSPTALVDIEASHELIFSRPAELAKFLIAGT